MRILPVLLLVILSGCSSRPDIVRHEPAFSASGQHRVYVVSHGWHTGFVIPSRQVYSRLPVLEKRFGNTGSIEFGWGDKGFYQAEEITSGLTFRAIFWPTESVMHTVSVPANVQEYFPNSEIISICMNDHELTSLLEFIADSFARDPSHDIIPLKNGLYGDSQFYKGVGDYYLMNTCNKWTAKGLRSSGMDISTTFKLTAGSIMNYLNSRTLCSRNEDRPVQTATDADY